MKKIFFSMLFFVSTVQALEIEVGVQECEYHKENIEIASNISLKKCGFNITFDTYEYEGKTKFVYTVFVNDEKRLTANAYEGNHLSVLYLPRTNEIHVVDGTTNDVIP